MTRLLELVEYFDELGEIVINVTAAVMCGEMTRQDAADYLAVAMNWKG